jgi:hypothetical protein
VQDLEVTKKMINHGTAPQRLPSRRPINIPTSGALTTLGVGCEEMIPQFMVLGSFHSPAQQG